MSQSEKRTKQIERTLRNLRRDARLFDGSLEMRSRITGLINLCKKRLYADKPRKDPAWLSAYNL